MIDNVELLVEIQADPLLLGYAGAGANPLAAMMNREGSASVEYSVVSSSQILLSKDKLLQKIDSVIEAANLKRLLASGTDLGDALYFKLNHTDTIDMTSASNIELINLMTADDDISTVQQPLKPATRDKILRLGKVLQSRSQELWGEVITVKKIKEVL